MTGPGLSPHERQILAQIEHDLRQADDILDRGLGTMRPARWWHTERLIGPARRITAFTVAALAVIALALTSVAADLHNLAATIAMATAWTLAVLALTAKATLRHNDPPPGP